MNYYIDMLPALKSLFPMCTLIKTELLFSFGTDKVLSNISSISFLFSAVKTYPQAPKPSATL